MTEPLRVLFCDDTRGALEGFAAEVATPLSDRVVARTAASLDGFRALVAAGEEFDLVASDLNFELAGGGPKDGLVLLREARRAFPDAELLLITAYSGSLSFQEGLELAQAGLAPGNVLAKVSGEDPRATWLRLRERIAGILQARAGGDERRRELLRERAFLRQRDLAATLERLAALPVPEAAAAIRADPGCGAHGIIGHSFVMTERLAAIERIARLQSVALVLGETGSGKEMVARALHDASPRRGRPFVKTDLSAVPRELVAAELFGHERGAFTGAQAKRGGLFAEADGGTIFLDEVGNLALELQPILLRVLQDRTFRPVGGDRDRQVDVFVIAAANVQLEALAADGRFRPDLLERLAVHLIELPPLRERREDVPLLAVCALDRLRQRFGASGFTRIERGALELLAREPWPRNVRQLENAIERLFGELDLATDPVTEQHVRRVLPRPAAGAADALEPLSQQVLDGKLALTLAEIARRFGNDAVCEVIEATMRRFRGPPDEETAARLFGGMRAGTWRQFAFKRGLTWEKIRRGETSAPGSS